MAERGEVTLNEYIELDRKQALRLHGYAFLSAAILTIFLTLV